MIKGVLGMGGLIFNISIVLNIIVWGVLITAFVFFTARRKLSEHKSRKQLKKQQSVHANELE